MSSIIVVGAGPAGLMAAIKLSDLGHKVTIIESMPKIARKLGISGKGRGNLTNTCSYNDFLKHFNNEGRFLKFAFKTFFNNDLIDFFNKEGLKTIEERGNRVFTYSGHATDAVACLHKAIQKRSIKLLTNTKVTELHISEKKCVGVTANNMMLKSDYVILATGGKSYPATGSTGDGYRFASSCGHTITQLFPSLCALKTSEDLSMIKNVLLKNIKAELRINNKKYSEEFGEMNFLDGNLAGPIIITLSRKVVPELYKKNKCEIILDLKPALDYAKLDNRILRDIESKRDGNLYDLMRGFLPADFCKFFIKKTGLNLSTKVQQITKEIRIKIRNSLKELKFAITGHDSWEQAIVTAGGISLKEINPTTMESKLVENLYFAGEIMDIDADTGGFNLQAAFSTGYLAAISINKKDGNKNL